MSATSDKVRNLIRGESREKLKSLYKQIDMIVIGLGMNKVQGEDIKKVTALINDITRIIKVIEDTKETIKFVQESLEAGRKAAEATEKASAIGAALNPAAAAIQYVQKFLIDKFKKDTKDIKEVVDESDVIIDDLKKGVKEGQKKLEEGKKNAEKQKKQEENLKKELIQD